MLGVAFLLLSPAARWFPPHGEACGGAHRNTTSAPHGSRLHGSRTESPLCAAVPGLQPEATLHRGTKSTAPHRTRNSNFGNRNETPRLGTTDGGPQVASLPQTASARAVRYTNRLQSACVALPYDWLEQEAAARYPWCRRRCGLAARTLGVRFNAWWPPLRPMATCGKER